MQRKDGRGFLRFPLFPGSLLLMEGATQDDWLQQVSQSSTYSVSLYALGIYKQVGKCLIFSCSENRNLGF